MYKTVTADTHLNSPKVIIFTGRRSKLIIGFAINEATVRPKPVKRSVSIPFSKTNPTTTEDTKNMETVSITKWRSILFTLYS
ncbi:MAG: hypothetical protein QY322_00890 [bacterium]|nr:MAG: hypothetical protein QY322_00890 [bacterium]